MIAWKQSAMEAANLLLGRPSDSLEFTVLILVGAIVFLILFHAITKLLSLPVTGIAMAGLTLIVLAAACVGAGALALVYLAPLACVRTAHLGLWVPFAAALVALVVVVAPAMCLIHRSRYGQSLVALLLGVGALAATLALTHAAYGAIKSGDREFERTRSRTDTVNEFLNH